MIHAWHTYPAGEGDIHSFDNCLCGAEIEIKTREDGTDGVVVAHQRLIEEEDAA